MMLTDKVSIEFLQNNNLTRGDKIGVPVDLSNLSKGLRWKSLFELTDDDYDALDRYFEEKGS